MSDLNTLRNDALRLLDNAYAKDVNCIKVNVNNTYEHELKKFELCFKIAKEKGFFITEACFKYNAGRCDILKITEDGIMAIEILKSEKLEDAKLKAAKYPVDVEFIKV